MKQQMQVRQGGVDAMTKTEHVNINSQVLTIGGNPITVVPFDNNSSKISLGASPSSFLSTQTINASNTLSTTQEQPKGSFEGAVVAMVLLLITAAGTAFFLRLVNKRIL